MEQQNQQPQPLIKTNWKFIVVMFASASIISLFIITFIQNFDLFWEYTKSNLLLGWLFFFYQLIVYLLTHYSLFLVFILVLSFTVVKAIRSKLLAIIYFVLPLLPFSFIASWHLIPFYIPIAALFLLIGIGIWKNKTVALVIAAIFNILLTIGGIILLRWTVNTSSSCEDLSCIALAIWIFIGGGALIFSLLTTPFIWYQIRMKSNLTNTKRVLFEATLIELGIVLIVIAGVIGGSSFLESHNRIEERRSIHQPRRDQERLTQKQAIQKGRETDQILYPSFIPWGWKKEVESVDKIQYVKYGVERQVLQVKQSSRSSFEAETKDGKEQTQILVNGRPAHYATWHSGICTIAKETRELWWYDDDILRSLDCYCPCTLSKSELVKISESMYTTR